ncbi:MAG: hypothetical protein HEEMFOPI_00892 [Holosporales bacterium]
MRSLRLLIIYTFLGFSTLKSSTIVDSIGNTLLASATSIYDFALRILPTIELSVAPDANIAHLGQATEAQHKDPVWRYEKLYQEIKTELLEKIAKEEALKKALEEKFKRTLRYRGKHPALQCENIPAQTRKRGTKEEHKRKAE